MSTNVKSLEKIDATELYGNHLMDLSELLHTMTNSFRCACTVKGAGPSGVINGKLRGYRRLPESIKICVFSKMFPTLNKDFFEMTKFQSKPLKPRGSPYLKTPNPEGFWITLKTWQARSDQVPSLQNLQGG